MRCSSPRRASSSTISARATISTSAASARPSTTPRPTTGVITYRDGVPTFPGYFQEEPYYDIANIQVLRGPQGTIVGQNATGGAVFVNTNDPIIGGGVHGYVNANTATTTTPACRARSTCRSATRSRCASSLYGERRDSFYQRHRPRRRGLYEPQRRHEDGRGPLQLAVEAERQFLDPARRPTSTIMDIGGYPASPATDFYKTIPGSTTPNPNYHDLFNITANAPMQARDKFVRSILRIEYDSDGGVKFRSISRRPECQHRLRHRSRRHQFADRDDQQLLLRQRDRDSVSARNSTSSRPTTSGSHGCSARSGCGTAISSCTPTATS